MKKKPKVASYFDHRWAFLVPPMGTAPVAPGPPDWFISPDRRSTDWHGNKCGDLWRQACSANMLAHNITPWAGDRAGPWMPVGSGKVVGGELVGQTDRATVSPIHSTSGLLRVISIRSPDPSASLAKVCRIRWGSGITNISLNGHGCCKTLTPSCPLTVMVQCEVHRHVLQQRGPP